MQYILHILEYILVIFYQSFLSLIFYVPFYKVFEQICTKGKPISFKAADVLEEIKLTATIILFAGLAFLCVTIVLHIFYGLLPGFYLSSILFLFLGSDAIFPSKGRKITNNCWVTRWHKNDFIVTLNDHKMLISGERLGGKPGHVIYKENSPKWLPPHENEAVLKEEYEYILNAVLKFLKKVRSQGAIQQPGEHIGPYITKEEMISEYARKGWRVEKLPDGSTKVSPPAKKGFFLKRLFRLFRNTTTKRSDSKTKN